MENPFANDLSLKMLAKNGAYYAVIYPDRDSTYVFLDFKDRFKAWNTASNAAKSGLWCYMADLTENGYPILAYLSGYCNCR